MNISRNFAQNIIKIFIPQNLKLHFISSIILCSFSVSSKTEQAPVTPEDEMQIIEVIGNKDSKKVTNSGFKVDVLLTDEFKNSNYNLIEVLKNSPGILVRESGGLGSNFELSLNGLSGNQVRYFFDGIPMEDFGSALTFPANLVEQMRVYKGVVPVSLGADALGGAVNIITQPLDSDALDLSYTFGSFNTHKTSIFAQKSFANDFFFRVSSNIEHSDNSYSMDEVPETDSFGNIIGTMSVDRFHDQYTGGMIKMKTGVANKSFADELSFGTTFGKNRNNEQHPAKSVNQIFGKYHSENETLLFSGVYKKKFTNFNINAYLLTGEVEDVVNDSYSRDYNWLGEYTEKNDPLQGELNTKSIFTITDKVTRASIGSSYTLSDTSSITTHYNHNYLKRSGHDSLNVNNTQFSLPNWIKKSILGLSYDDSDLAENLEFSIFAKQYLYQGEINAEEVVDSNYVGVKTLVDFDKIGYGTALSYQLFDSLRTKFSYEKAYRLPEAVEILGTGKYVLPNASLEAEESHNINIGFLAEFSSDNTFNRFEGNYFYRDSSDFIRYVPVQVIFGVYKNLQKVQTKGVEASYYISFFDNYSLQLNLTYQDITNKSKYDSYGITDLNFNKRMPNEPYLFSNLRLSTDFELFDMPMSAFWTTSFVEKFFLNWESTGSSADKLYIPQQITHDIDLEYSFGEDNYSISLSARNILDADVYDNFKIEKPGRAFYLKFKYTF